MITFIISLLTLVVGYFLYGTLAERVFGVDASRPTPAIANPDGIDYVPLPWWKIFLIQFLNIAGLGPIFGAIMGIMFGPAAFIWIVLGTLLAGAVHDYMSGMMSVRQNGASLPEIVGAQLGIPVKQFMRCFTVVLMLLVGAVFVSGPADLLVNITDGAISRMGWIWIVFGYYVLATLLPIDKLIGRFYPIFGFALLFMAVGIMISLFMQGGGAMPEVTLDMVNNHPDGLPIFPMMFISIACGAISGFHATQSPMMARCMQNEKQGRRIFYGAMVAEGVVALIWAAAAATFFGSLQGLNQFAAEHGNNAAIIVDKISKEWLGTFGGILAMLGVVAAPITSGDTALRSARLIVADFMNLEQRSIKKRQMVSIPLFVITILILQMNFAVLWRYFAWGNQTLAVFTLWAITVYLARNGRFFWLTLFPAMFMTSVSVSYILYAPEGLQLNYTLSVVAGIVAAVALCILFMMWRSKQFKKSLEFRIF